MKHDDDVLVSVENLSKKFCKDLKTGLWYGLKDLFSGLGNNADERNLRDKEFWALKDISFELHRGECLGLIGHNGAGKSTLLKILNGLINPDAGKVTMKGRVGALIELGAGFNPILTGRENIYNNGAVLGFTRKEIDGKVEEIIDFSELREFIDMPVQHYSSGMKVRLGFAVAAQMEPDILLIDEVLAVGDMGFRLKCFKKIDDILPKTAIIFVSHSTPQISRTCDRVLLLENGLTLFNGNQVGQAIDLYYSKFNINETSVMFSDESIEIEEIKIVDFYELIGQIPVINWNDDLKIYFKLKFTERSTIPNFLISIFDQEQRPVAYFTENNIESELLLKNQILEFIVIHENLQLSKGIYSINIHISEGKLKSPILRIQDALEFQIKHENDIYPPFLLNAKYTQI